MRSLRCHCQPPSRVICSTNDLHVPGLRVGTKAKYLELTHREMGLPPLCHRYCWNSLAKVLQSLIQPPCALTGKLSSSPCFRTECSCSLEVTSPAHFKNKNNKGTLLEALFLPASPDKRLSCNPLGCRAWE